MVHVLQYSKAQQLCHSKLSICVQEGFKGAGRPQWCARQHRVFEQHCTAADASRKALQLLV
jgi:hypothetical protein